MNFIVKYIQKRKQFEAYVCPLPMKSVEPYGWYTWKSLLLPDQLPDVQGSLFNYFFLFDVTKHTESIFITQNIKTTLSKKCYIFVDCL